MLGYETYVTINNIVGLTTSADISLDRSRIESGAIYGGSIETLSSIPLQQSHYYDWSGVTANITVDLTEDFLTMIKNMINHRNTPIDFHMYSRVNGEKQIKNAWWNSISISANEDSLITATISFMAIERDLYDIGKFEDYWLNENGLINCATIPDPLNQGQLNVSPIPFWNSEITGFDYVKNWTFTISQDVVKFMGCMNKQTNVDTAIEPYVWGVGVVRSDMKINTLPPILSSSDIWAMPGVYTGQDIVTTRKEIPIKINNSTILTLKGELTKNGDPLQGNNSVDNIEWDYMVYEID